MIDLYVHSGTGHDAAQGTAAHPLRSTPGAFSCLPDGLRGRRARINYLPGHVESLGRLSFPAITGCGPIDDVAADGAEPSWDYLRPQILLQAAPAMLEDVNGPLEVADPTSKLLMVTDTSKSWTPGQHVGKGIINPGAPAELGVVCGNTTTSLLVAMVSGGFSDGSLRLIDRQATLTFTDSFQIASTSVSIGLVGLNLRSAVSGKPALDILSQGLVEILGCEIKGGLQARDGASRVTADACWIHEGFLSIDVHNLAIRQSFLDQVTPSVHAISGQYDLYGCRVTRSGSMGHGGSGTPSGGFRVANCWISDGTQDGVVSYGGIRARITDTRIDECAGDAIYVDGTGTTILNTVTGSGSMGHGCSIGPGANVLVRDGIALATTVSGGLGQVLLAGAPCGWAQAPRYDGPTLSRFG